MTDIAALRQQLQTAEAQWYAERLNLEQLLHQSERERDELVSSQAESQQNLTTSRLELDQARGEIQRLKQALEQSDEKLDRLQSSKGDLAADLDTERARVTQLVSRLAALETEADRVREDCARYSERQIELTKQLNETERALAMEKALKKPVEIQLGDAEQRQKLLQNQNEILQQELEARSEQLLELQRKHGAHQGEMSNLNEVLKAQCKEWESKYQLLVTETSSLRNKLTEALNQVQEERNASVSAACQYQSELDAEKQLSAKLKRSLADAKQNIEELDEVIESLRTDYKAATDRIHELEQKLAEVESALKASEDNVSSMRNELEAVKEQHQPPLAIEPAEKVSLDGVKIEDIYARLRQTGQQLIDERAKSRKLQLYLEQIKEEMNEQYPLMQEQRSDYENLLKVNNSLAFRVQECNYQRDQLERKLQQALQSAEYESKQRQELIHFIKQKNIEGFDENSGLQVAVVSQEDNDIKSWRKLVEQLEDELKKRDLQLARLDTEIRSRQLRSPVPITNGGPAPPLAIASSPAESPDQSLINELREQVEILQSEKTASERQLQSNVDEARQQCHDLTIKLATSSGTIAILNQKLDWMTSQANRLSAESETLRANDAKRDAMLISLQEKITSLTADLGDANQRYTRSSNQLQQVRAQLELARQTEERLTEKCGDMAVLRQHNEQLLATMQSVQQKLETGQASNVQQLVAEKERIYQDMLQTQKQAAVERRTLQQNIKVLEEQCHSLQMQLEVANKATAEANAQLAQLSAAASAAESAHVKLMEELRTVKNERDLLAGHAQTDEEGGGRQLMIELAHAQADLQSSQEKLAALTTEANEWKALCEQRAQLLDELDENLKAQRQRSENEIQVLQNRVEELTEQCRKCDQQYEDLLSQLDQKDSLSVNKAKELEVAVADADRRAAEAEQKCHIAQEVAESKGREAADYRKRYETELTGHAQAVSAVNEIRQQLASLQQELESARQTESDAVEALNAIQQQSQQEIASLNDHLKQARETIANLDKKNDLLLAQIETGRSAKSDAAEEGDEADRTRQIITFLRSEKEIAEAEAESASRQNVRLKTELEQLRASLDQARDEIAKLHERESSMQVVTDVKPSEDVSVLLESNQMLRTQKMELMKQLKQLEEGFDQVQQMSGPMQSQIAELNATVLSLQAEKSVLQADVERWKTRNQQLLSRYNQVDPELYRQAKESLAEAKQEIEQLQTRLHSKDNQITELQEKLVRANQGQANVEAIRKSAVFNLQQVNSLKKELASRPDPAQIVTQLSEAQKCIKTLRALCARSRAVLERRNETVASLNGQIDSQKSEISSLNLKASDLLDRLTECESLMQKTEERHAAEMTSSQDQVSSLQLQLAEANDRAQMTTSPEPTSPTAAPSTAATEQTEDVVPQQKRPPSPLLQPAPKKLKSTQPEEQVATTESEKQEKPEKPQLDEALTVPIRRLRRNRAASTSQEATVQSVSESAPAEEEGEGGGGAEEESAAATAAGPNSDVEEGELDDDSDPNHNTSMDI